MSHPSYSIALSAILAATSLSFDGVAGSEPASSHRSPIITVGGYVDGNSRPLLGVSHDDGVNWAYPKDITHFELPQSFSSGLLLSASCDDTLCVATGAFFDNKTVLRPLLAFSRDSGMTWTYPQEIHTALPAATNGGLFSGRPSCKGSTCIAVGSYSDHNKSYPLLAVTNDKNVNWFYANQGVELDSNESAEFLGATCIDAATCMAVGFRTGDKPYLLFVRSSDSGVTWSVVPQEALPTSFDYERFNGGISCSEKTCIMSGEYDNNDRPWPLLAVSHDKGMTWHYPPKAALPSHFMDGTLNRGSSCSGEVCVATGSYHDKTTQRPLLAFTNDGGATWSYPQQLIDGLPESLLFGEFYDASCNGTTCVVVGEYTDDNETTYPLLAVTHDKGVSWCYKQELSSPDLPTPFVRGMLKGVYCHDEFCFASGSYSTFEREREFTMPLLMVSRDGGITWSYSSSALSKEVLPYPFWSGFFYGVGHSASMLQNSSDQVIKPPKRLI